MTGRAACVSCLCSFYDAVDLSGTSNALYFCFPVTFLLSVCALSPVAVCWPPDAARYYWLFVLEMSKAVHNPAHPDAHNSVCQLVIIEGTKETAESLSKSLMEISEY